MFNSFRAGTAFRRMTFIYVRSEMHYAFLVRFRRLQTVPVLKGLIHHLLSQMLLCVIKSKYQFIIYSLKFFCAVLILILLL